jgi:hypothetical protein
LRIYGSRWWIKVGRIFLLAMIISSLSDLVFGFHYLQQANNMKGKMRWPLFHLIPHFFETFMLQAREVFQEELRDIMKSHGYNVLIPHYIPHGIKFSAIYYKCCPLVVVIAYSDRGVKDYRFANITIEIAPFHPKFAPSKEYMQRLNSPQVVRGHNQRLCGSNHSKD